ncbi:hypothetical protein VV869_20860 [Photobacterium sp. MCCC 1A19761]|uniref:hypothetical protein n=1 Tax=Photobacterium sp. MCCC 1A19761 TaxID=3115000 RepID=UPI00307DBF0D
MAKLDQKFSKGSKFKKSFDDEEELFEFSQPSKKKKRRIARQRDEYQDFEESRDWDYQ